MLSKENDGVPGIRHFGPFFPTALGFVSYLAFIKALAFAGKRSLGWISSLKHSKNAALTALDGTVVRMCDDRHQHQVRIPGEGERDSGIKVNGIPG